MVIHADNSLLEALHHTFVAYVDMCDDNVVRVHAVLRDHGREVASHMAAHDIKLRRDPSNQMPLALSRATTGRS